MLPDDSGYSIEAHFYLLVISRKIKKYLRRYYVNLGISQEINSKEKKWPIKENGR